MDREQDILVTEATATFGSQHLGLKWLQSPCECLEHRVPAEVAKSRDGFREVLDILYRIQGTIVHHPSPRSSWYSPKGMDTDTEPRWHGRRR